LKEKSTLKLLLEMMKNSRRSDRDLARVLHVSQPTITRARQRLEKDYIETYTLIPKFDKIGYEILALTFFKSKTYEKSETEELISFAKEWCMKHSNVIFASDGEGMGKDAVMVSFHKSYSDYADFMRGLTVEGAKYVMDVQSFLVSVKNGIIMKPFDIKYLAEDKLVQEE
jgi:DNA-binding Lrp family transcriptional regulator